MHVRILESLRELAPYRDAWAAHLAPTPFASYAVYERWMAHQPRQTRPFVVVVLDEDGQLVALAPWIMRTSGGLRRLSGLTDAWYQDPLFLQPARSREAARLIVTALKRVAWRWDLLDLNVQDSLSEPLLAELDGLGRAHVERIDGWQTRIIRFEADWDAYWQQRSKNFRHKSKRNEARLAGVPHRWYVADDSNLPALVAEVFDRHAARWTPTARKNWAGYYAMYRAIADQAMARGELFLFVLEIEGQPAAFKLSIRHGDWAYWIFQIYDPAFSVYSPSNLLTMRALQHFYELGLRQVDPGGGDDPWKESLMTESLRTLQPLIASPASLTGNALVAWKGRVRPWLKEYRWFVSTIRSLREAKHRLFSPRAVPNRISL
ncbi:MAG TPA: GNAT family N-acetyltransferase [Stenomitos sp.]